ncbi:glycosyltransferase family 25 protein [Endozoicomonas sp. 4G]|uniref:glycosyltransferase family 25 protein n=1 Tax=Endozoicomonas sp. 4G TaxID=2872754 RepID=UPI00207895D5|nr:glycosyltransferase family 25 protein [Endozoicomonas sp. 4G]
MSNPINSTLIDFPVFVICMEREVDRRIEVAEHLTLKGVNFEFSNAVDGHELSNDQKNLYSESQSIKHGGRPLALGEIGCYLSHTSIWQKIVDEQIPCALILESDVVLTQESIECLKNIKKSSVSWDLMMMFYRECLPSIWHKTQLTKKSKIVKFTNKSSCTTAYLVTEQGAKKLLKHAYPLYMPVDDYMTGGYINKDLKTFAVYPRNVHLTDDALESSSIREDLFPLLKDLGIKRRLPGETTMLKEVEKNIRRQIKRVLPPPWL